MLDKKLNWLSTMMILLTTGGVNVFAGTQITSKTASPHDEHQEFLDQFNTVLMQAPLRRYVVSSHDEVAKEVRQCSERLKSEALPLVRNLLKERGNTVLNLDFETDPTLYWVFGWPNKISPPQRPSAKNPPPYEFLQKDEYILVNYKAWVIPKGSILPRREIVELPLHQNGKVIRDEVKKEDRVEMIWQTLQAPLEVVKVHRGHSVKEIQENIMASSNVEQSKSIGPPPDFGPELRGLKCLPSKARTYPINDQI